MSFVSGSNAAAFASSPPSAPRARTPHRAATKIRCCANWTPARSCCPTGWATIASTVCATSFATRAPLSCSLCRDRTMWCGSTGGLFVTLDDELRQSFGVNGKHPRSVIVFEIKEIYTQCARALMRAGLWDGRDDSEGLPSVGTNPCGPDRGARRWAKPMTRNGPSAPQKACGKKKAAQIARPLHYRSNTQIGP